MSELLEAVEIGFGFFFLFFCLMEKKGVVGLRRLVKLVSGLYQT